MRERLASHLGNLMITTVEMGETISNLTADRDRTYELMAECIRSDQMSHADVVAKLQSEPKFAAWYQARYGKSSVAAP